MEFMELVVLLVIIGFFALAIYNGKITLFIVTGLFLAMFIFLKIYEKVKAQEAERKDAERTREWKRKADEEAERARELKRKADEEARIKKHKEEQERLFNNMITLGNKSLSVFEEIPEHIRTAEEYLNQAEIDLKERAFAPFWDSIEYATTSLGHFDEGVKQINNNLSQYTELIKKYDNIPPQFPLARKSADKLSIANSASGRMKVIVRSAQCDFHFATIYEQRKTNQILVAGFTNLAQALNRIEWQISKSMANLAKSVDIMSSTLNDSMDHLADSVDSMSSTLNYSMNETHSRLDDMAQSVDHHHNELLKIKNDQVAREKRALKMLDNIQHHRKPSIFDQ
ncbi:MAG: hypothetical protein ISR54_10930 [Chlorobium phaeobacteroides]|uniref:Uncharacterized protein n=1 Tax=Chlorobium phaeobacteroides (strain BS1) TaxID=331678 RepID=B3EKE0_CHLPB|nr:hypothetical protein [Chlorobium phaeobacteroides]